MSCPSTTFLDTDALYPGLLEDTLLACLTADEAASFDSLLFNASFVLLLLDCVDFINCPDVLSLSGQPSGSLCLLWWCSCLETSSHSSLTFLCFLLFSFFRTTLWTLLLLLELWELWALPWLPRRSFVDLCLLCSSYCLSRFVFFISNALSDPVDPCLFFGAFLTVEICDSSCLGSGILDCLFGVAWKVDKSSSFAASSKCCCSAKSLVMSLWGAWGDGVFMIWLSPKCGWNDMIGY